MQCSQQAAVAQNREIDLDVVAANRGKSSWLS
jgi:hypothetical protein